MSWPTLSKILKMELVLDVTSMKILMFNCQKSITLLGVDVETTDWIPDYNQEKEWKEGGKRRGG